MNKDTGFFAHAELGVRGWALELEMARLVMECCIEYKLRRHDMTGYCGQER